MTPNIDSNNLNTWVDRSKSAAKHSRQRTVINHINKEKAGRRAASRTDFLAPHSQALFDARVTQFPHCATSESTVFPFVFIRVHSWLNSILAAWRDGAPYRSQATDASKETRHGARRSAHMTGCLSRCPVLKRAPAPPELHPSISCHRFPLSFLIILCRRISLPKRQPCDATSRGCSWWIVRPIV